MVTDHLDDIIQPGADTARVMVNGTAWLTRDFPDDPLRLVDVDDMTPEHQRRLLAYLRAHAYEQHWFARKAIKEQFQRREIDAIQMATQLTLIGAVPELWLEDTALVRRLVQLVAREPRRERQRWLPARLRRTP